ncbi:hypothetical protein DNN95_24400, partial [Escherichia coli]|uniref:hypothetical protein n=1 Tax=Escherichia coli TaxID=562 RepID=UPI00159344DA
SKQTIELVEGKTEYEFTFEHGNTEDVYKDAESIKVEAELTGGGYKNAVADATAEAKVEDTIQTTTAEVTLTQLEDGSVQVSLELTSAPDAGHSATVTYTVNGEERTATFASGQTSFVDPETVAVSSDAYGTATKVEVVVSKIEGGNYEATAGT